MKRSDDSISALNPTVRKLGFISFLQDLSSEMLVPVTPIFLSTVLGANMASIGLIEGVAEAVSSILKGVAGRWSDRLGRRKVFVWSGYLLATLAKPLTGFAGSWTHVLFARSLDRFGKGLRTAPRDALLAEAVVPEKRGEAFGWHRGMDTLGAALGPLIALAFLNFASDNLRDLFVWALLPGLCAVALAFTLKDPSRAVEAKAAEPASPPLGKSFFGFLAVWAVFALVNSTDAFLILKMQKSGISMTLILLLYCAFNLFYAFLSPSLGGLSDRLGRERILRVGLVLFALVYAGFAFADRLWQFALLWIFYGVYMAATEGVSKALAVDLVPPAAKGTGLGYFGAVTGLVSIAGNFIAGDLWDRFGASAPFLYGSAGSLLAAILLFFLAKPRGGFVSPSRAQL
jgi:MFS family permease